MIQNNILAFDTSTNTMFVALQAHGRQWLHRSAGGKQASAALIPTLLQLLAQAELQMTDLQAIAVGIGPGSFTGLRTACAVAQGLAFANKIPVLPIPTLQLLAEQARLQHGSRQVLTLLDARMDQVYAAAWQWQDAQGWSLLGNTQVLSPEAVQLPAPNRQNDKSGWVLAGNAFEAYGARLQAPLQDLPHFEALPTGQALLSLAPLWLQAGRAVDAAQALPLYIRNKVAQTTAERTAAQDQAHVR